MSRQIIVALLIAVCSQLQAQESGGGFPPHRYVTSGPRLHWFGYYDKLQFDPTGRYVLGMQVPFEHRSPTADDVIEIGMIDLQLA